MAMNAVLEVALLHEVTNIACRNNQSCPRRINQGCEKIAFDRKEFFTPGKFYKTGGARKPNARTEQASGAFNLSTGQWMHPTGRSLHSAEFHFDPNGIPVPSETELDSMIIGKSVADAVVAGLDFQWMDRFVIKCGPRVAKFDVIIRDVKCPVAMDSPCRFLALRGAGLECEAGSGCLHGRMLAYRAVRVKHPASRAGVAPVECRRSCRSLCRFEMTGKPIGQRAASPRSCAGMPASMAQLFRKIEIR